MYNVDSRVCRSQYSCSLCTLQGLELAKTIHIHDSLIFYHSTMEKARSFTHQVEGFGNRVKDFTKVTGLVRVGAITSEIIFIIYFQTPLFWNLLKISSQVKKSLYNGVNTLRTYWVQG